MTEHLWIGLAGRARSGKDTIADHLVERHGFTKVSHSDAVKEMALELNPWVVYGRTAKAPLSDVVAATSWEYAKDAFDDVRVFLQRLAISMCDRLGEDYWSRQAVARARKIDGPVVFSSVRLPADVVAIEDHTPSVVARVVRYPLTAAASEHVTETALDDFELYNIDNRGGIEELRHRVDALLFAFSPAPRLEDS